MKVLSLILVGIGLLSFTPDEGAGTLKEAHLKGKVKSIAYYTSYPEDTADNTLWFSEIYDEKGYKVVTKYYGKDKLDDSIYYTYDAKGRVIEENSVSWKTKYSYDESGKLMETNRYKQEDGFLMEKVTFGYDANGKENEQDSYYNGVTLNNRMTIAASDTTREETSYKPDGEMERKDENHYNTNGNLAFSKQYTDIFNVKDNRYIVYVYDKYDNMGNWVKRTGSITSMVNMVDRPERNTTYKAITTRKIEYYK